MGHQRRVIRTVLLLFGLVAAGCAGDDHGSVTEGRVEAVDAEPTTTATTIEQPDDAESSTPASRPPSSKRSEFDCPDTTTTTGATTSTGLPSVCALIDEIPPDELPAEGVGDYVVWSGTISGSIQAPGCDAVSQSGEIILVVFSEGDLSGAGQTVAGAYTCANGASIAATTNSYGIDGRMTDVFTLTFTDGVQLSSGAIEGGHAVILQDTEFGLVTIDLVCENC